MLKFNEVGRLFALTNNEPSERRKSKKSAPVYVVGHEKNNIFLVARDDLFMSRSCFEMVDISKGDRRVLYVDEHNIKCVSASLNHDKTILAYTTLRKRSESDDEKIYESFFLLDGTEQNNNRFLFNVKGSVFQSIQFIHEPNPQRNKTWFLFFRDKERIEMYNIETEKRKGYTSIVTQPELHTTLVRNYLWCEWDPQHSLLYYIVPQNNAFSTMNSGKNETDGSKGGHSLVDCVLKCCSFADIRRPTIIFESTQQLMLPNGIFSDASRNYEKTPWRNGHRSPDTTIHFQVVRLSERAICLCQQIIQPQKSDIQIVIYVLHHRTQIRYTIPMNDWKESSNQKVFFGSLNGLLMVYLPGIHLQFFDCGKDHSPWDSLSLNGPEEVPHLPHYYFKKENIDDPKTQSSEILTPLQAPYVKTSVTNGLVILNLRKGFVYEYQFSYDFLEKWFLQQRNPRVYVQVLHLAIMHIKNDKFTLQLLEGLCTKLIKYATAEVFTEYLLAKSFMEAKKQRLEPEFLRCIPLSIQERFPFRTNGIEYDKLQGTYQHKNAFFVRASRMTVIDLTREIGIKYDRSTLERSHSFTNLSSQSKHKRTSSVSLLFSFFGTSKKETPLIMQEKSEKSVSLARAWKRLFADVLTEQIYLHFQVKDKSKTQAAQWAQSYSDIASDLTERLYSFLIRLRAQKPPDKWYFYLLEHVFGALEETTFPPPAEFYNHFTAVGFDVLPKKKFLQYISRDIFTVNVDLIKKAIARNCEPEFISLLLRRLEDKHIKFYEKLSGDKPYVIQFYHSLVPLSCSPEDILQAYNRSLDQKSFKDKDIPQFAPLNFYLIALELNLGGTNLMKYEYQYIKQNSVLHMSKLIKPKQETNQIPNTENNQNNTE